MSDTFASVLKIDPDWTRLTSDVPPAVRTLLKRCLAKDRRQRVSDIAAAKFILSEHAILGSTAHAATASATAATADARSHWLIPAMAGALLTAIIAIGIAWALRPTQPTPVVSQFSFTLPEGQVFSNVGRQTLAISPDGTHIVYVANQRLYVRAINDIEPHAIPGTESDLGSFNPVFEPDGKTVAFFSTGDGGVASLRRIPLTGGAPSFLANTIAPSGASWGPAGILLGQGGVQGPGAIIRVPANGGMPERLITVGQDERIHGPQLLPDGKTVLFTFTKTTTPDRWDHAQIVAQSLTGGVGSRHVLIESGSDARYLPTGHLIFAEGGTIFAVPFDVSRVAVTGSPVPVVVGVRRAAAGQTASAHLAISASGTLVYRPGPVNTSSTMRSLVLGDDKGALSTLKLPPANYAHPRVSRDGRWLAVGRTEGAASDIWTYDLAGKSEITRLTFEGKSRFPVWSADGSRVTYQSTRDGDSALWWQSPVSGNAERLTKAAPDEEHVPESWSPDGKRLLFSIVKKAMGTLWVLSLDSKHVERFGTAESAEAFSATFSPDGQYVAYARTPTSGGGRSADRGVFVEPFPATGTVRQAPKTTAIDYHPVWSADGKIYFVPASTRVTVAMPITLQPRVEFGTPVDLPRLPRPALLSTDVRGYDLLPDGRAISLSPGADDAQASGEVRVVLNWFEELKRLVPTK